ncbi:methyl-accepting chemotaxis protein [Aciduricibacillus chroicocephali]|uniref:Methyl-accepting chemotaxis protein n=1 Tax=Aciduricibacillus chroicocephali TaxID=3054939 RepID=A0ABY9KUW3_9BACI|nr:methyl-accepting chemotaxis protein [Bacillaceae bacterium 44XB]
MKFLKSSVRNRLTLVFALILFIPSISVGLLSYKSAKETTEEQIVGKAHENVKLLGTIVNDSLKPHMDNLDKLAGVVNADMYKGKDSRELRTLLDQYKDYHPDVYSIYVGAFNSDLILSPWQELDLDPRTRPWYKDAMEHKGEVILTKPYADARSGEMVETIAKAADDGSGVIGIDVAINHVSEMASKVSVGKNGYMMLLDQEGTFITHPNKEVGTTAEQPYYKKLLQKKSGSYNFSENGKKRKMIFNTDELTGWKVAGVMDVSEASSTARPILNYILSILAAAFIIWGVIGYFLIRSIIRPLKELNESAIAISSGDLTEKAAVYSNDEIGKVAQSFNVMSDNLRELIQEVDQSAEQVAASAEELTASSEQTAAAADEVSSGIQFVAKGAEDQESGLKENVALLQDAGTEVTKVSDRATAVAQLAKEAAKRAEEGGVAVSRSMSQMNNIHQSVTASNESIQLLSGRSKEIENIVETIVGISEQTNLLSLNAAIEAARAGESGKGFSVVADEVRKLAEQSQQSAKQIASLIGSIQTDTANSAAAMHDASVNVMEGLKLSSETSEQFAEIVDSIQAIEPRIVEVAEICEYVAASVQQVTTSATELTDVSRGNAAAAEEIASSTSEQLAAMNEVTSAAKSLAELSEELQHLIKTFKI